MSDPGDASLEARPLSEWDEDIGDALWWRFPIVEAPYVGTPLDLGQTVEIEFRTNAGTVVHRHLVGGWPDYHTHWTPLPPMPREPNSEPALRAGHADD